MIEENNYPITHISADKKPLDVAQRYYPKEINNEDPINGDKEEPSL